MQAKPHKSTVLAVTAQLSVERALEAQEWSVYRFWGCRKATEKAQIPHMWREYERYLIGSVCMSWVIEDEIN